MRWGLGRVPAGVVRDRKPFPSRWSRSILACGVWCGRGCVGRSVSGGDVASVRAGLKWSGLKLTGSAHGADRGGRARGRSNHARRAANAPHTPHYTVDTNAFAHGGSARTRIAMATTAEPAINVRRMLPNSVGPSSSSLS